MGRDVLEVDLTKVGDDLDRGSRGWVRGQPPAGERLAWSF